MASTILIRQSLELVPGDDREAHFAGQARDHNLCGVAGHGGSRSKVDGFAPRTQHVNLRIAQTEPDAASSSLGGSCAKAHRRLYHSTQGARASFRTCTKSNKEEEVGG